MAALTTSYFRSELVRCSTGWIFFQLNTMLFIFVLLLSFDKNEANMNLSSSWESSLVKNTAQQTQNSFSNASAYLLGSYDGMEDSSSFNFINTESISNQTRVINTTSLANEILNYNQTVTSGESNSFVSESSNGFASFTSIANGMDSFSSEFVQEWSSRASTPTSLPSSGPVTSITLLQPSSSMQLSMETLNMVSPATTIEQLISSSASMSSLNSKSSMPTVILQQPSSVTEDPWEEFLSSTALDQIASSSASTSLSSFDSLLSTATLQPPSLLQVSADILDISSISTVLEQFSMSSTLTPLLSYETTIEQSFMPLTFNPLPSSASTLSIATLQPSSSVSFSVAIWYASSSATGLGQFTSPTTLAPLPSSEPSLSIATPQPSSTMQSSVDTTYLSAISTAVEQLPPSPMPTLLSSSGPSIPVKTLQLSSSLHIPEETLEISPPTTASSSTSTFTPSFQSSLSLATYQAASSIHLLVETFKKSSSITAVEQLTSSSAPTFMPNFQSTLSASRSQAPSPLHLSVDTFDKSSTPTTNEQLTSSSASTSPLSSTSSLPIAILQLSSSAQFSMKTLTIALISTSLEQLSMVPTFSPSLSVDKWYTILSSTIADQIPSSSSSTSTVPFQALSSLQLSIGTLDIFSSSAATGQLPFSSATVSLPVTGPTLSTTKLQPSLTLHLSVDALDRSLSTTALEKISSLSVSKSLQNSGSSLSVAGSQPPFSQHLSKEDASSKFSSSAAIEQVPSSFTSISLSRFDSLQEIARLQASSSLHNSVDAWDLTSTSNILRQFSTLSTLTPLPSSELSLSLSTFQPSSSLHMSAYTWLTPLASPVNNQLTSSSASTPSLSPGLSVAIADLQPSSSLQLSVDTSSHVSSSSTTLQQLSSSSSSATSTRSENLELLSLASTLQPTTALYASPSTLPLSSSSISDMKVGSSYSLSFSFIPDFPSSSQTLQRLLSLQSSSKAIALSSSSIALVQVKSSHFPTHPLRPDSSSSLAILKPSLSLGASLHIWPSSYSKSSIRSEVTQSSPSHYRSFLTPTMNTPGYVWSAASPMVESNVSIGIVGSSSDSSKDKTTDLMQEITQSSKSVNSVLPTDELDASIFPLSNTLASDSFYRQDGNYITSIRYSPTESPSSVSTRIASTSGSGLLQPYTNDPSPATSTRVSDAVTSRLSLKPTSLLPELKSLSSYISKSTGIESRNGADMTTDPSQMFHITQIGSANLKSTNALPSYLLTVDATRTFLTNSMERTAAIRTSAKKPMTYSSVTLGGSMKLPILNVSSSIQAPIRTSQDHVITSEAYSQKHGHLSVTPHSAPPSKVSAHNQSPSLEEVEATQFTDMSTTARDIHPRSINKISKTGISLSMPSTIAASNSLINTELFSSGSLSAEIDTTNILARKSSVLPYETDTVHRPYPSDLKFSLDNTPATLSMLATETLMYTGRAILGTAFVKKLESSMLENYRSPTIRKSRNSILHFSVITSAAKPSLASVGVGSHRIQSTDSNSWTMKKQSSSFVLEVNENAQTRTQAYFETRPQLEATETSQSIPYKVYPTPQKQKSDIEHELHTHTTNVYSSLVFRASIKERIIQSTKHRRMPEVKDSPFLSPTNNKSKIMTIDILHKSTAAKNESEGSISSLFNSSQKIVQLNTNDHTIQPSPSSSTGTSSKASRNSIVTTEPTISDGEQITKNMEMEMQLGNVIQMNGMLVQQDEALKLLQESRSDMRLRVERALAIMVRESMQGNYSMLKNLIGCTGFSFRKGSIIAKFRIVFKNAVQISDPSLVTNAVKARVLLLQNNTIFKDSVGFFINPTSIQAQDFDECQYPAGTFCHINAKCDNSPIAFSFSCTCNGGYQGNGTHCTPMKANNESSGHSSTGILIAIFLVVGVIIIVLLAFACVKKGNIRAKVRDARIHLHLYPQEAWSEA